MANPLGYEPHTNFLVNFKNADQCESLSEIRYEIDTIDHLIVKLMHIRMKYALQTLKFKSDGKPIPDNQRIVRQLKQRKAWAIQYELDPLFIQSFFKLMIDWYMTQQIHFYHKLNPHQTDLQIQFASLAKLQSMEYDLDWIDIDIDHFDHFIDLAYDKSQSINESILVSFTQKIDQWKIDPINLFEHVRHLSLSDVFLFFNSSKQSYMFTFGNEKHFPIANQHQWKHLLSNAIIDKSMSSYGPILTSILSFQQYQSSSLILPRIQLNSQQGNTFLTFNSIVNNKTKDHQLAFIHEETVSLLEYSRQIFNNIKQSQNEISKDFSFHFNNSDQWKEIVSDAFNQIQNGHLQSIVLTRQNQMKTDENWSFTDFYSSSYFNGILKEGNCYLNVSPFEFIFLEKNHFQYTIFNKQSSDENNWITNQLKSLTETYSIENDCQPILIKGNIEKDVTLVELIKSLHFNPSIIGYPLMNALKYLEDKQTTMNQEDFPFYVGWIDTNGDGQFVRTSKSIVINEDTTRLFTLFHIDQQTDVENSLF